LGFQTKVWNKTIKGSSSLFFGPGGVLGIKSSALHLLGKYYTELHPSPRNPFMLRNKGTAQAIEHFKNGFAQSPSQHTGACSIHPCLLQEFPEFLKKYNLKI
jgi:hypothetical protein